MKKDTSERFKNP
jgi:chromosome segregation ATPase